MEPIVDHLLSSAPSTVKQTKDDGVAGRRGGGKGIAAKATGLTNGDAAAFTNGFPSQSQEMTINGFLVSPKHISDKPKNVLPLCHPATHVWADGELVVSRKSNFNVTTTNRTVNSIRFP